MSGFTFNSDSAYSDETIQRALDQLNSIPGPLAGPLNALRRSMQAELRVRSAKPLIDTAALKARKDADAALKADLHYLANEAQVSSADEVFLVEVAQDLIAHRTVTPAARARVHQLADQQRATA
ncbi:hypothetical protein [Roseomonas harenae]|uniref:hypothetical protein n=1 Tax=Muricoccus harenae TaxID=2692566 RepID=UPI0013311FF7|nr:hypothetical protein [Roseomonas harenae]